MFDLVGFTPAEVRDIVNLRARYRNDDADYVYDGMPPIGDPDNDGPDGESEHSPACYCDDCALAGFQILFGDAAFEDETDMDSRGGAA